MGIRVKLFLVFFACGVVPMLVFTVANYLNGVSAVEDLLRLDVQREARAVANNIETTLREREASLVTLARSSAMRNYVRSAMKQTASARNDQSQTPTPEAAPPTAAPSPNPSNVAANDDPPPPDVRAEVDALLADNRDGYIALTCLNSDGQALFQTTPPETGNAKPRYQTKDILSSSFTPNPRVWTTPEQTPLRATLWSGTGLTFRYTVPVFATDASEETSRAALVVDIELKALCKNAVSSFAVATTVPRLFIILDETGRIVFHTNEVFSYQPVAATMPPSFKPIADSMKAGETGEKFFDWTEDNRWLVTYQPVKAAGVFLAVGGNDTAVLQRLRPAGWMSIILSAVAGLATAILLMFIARRMERSIERVTAGAVAIAGGRLDQRIEVRSSDETRLLAESFNQMTDRLREQIAREAESRQFESFMRLAAMLTHDLKNAITALSLVVSNMEQQFDREEFRAEAMESLKESTDKLRSLVAKLSGPVESLSGEYQRPRPTDLVPYIKRVLSGTAEVQSQHQVEIHLPSSLVATVDAERVEKVFENLILNALEAMGTKSGTLIVEAGPENDKEIFFSVSDTGPGITEEFQRTRLFRAFATTKRKGVGLGLYTCREIVRAHGGRIEVKSEKGAGATFRVVLPSGRFKGDE